MFFVKIGNKEKRIYFSHDRKEEVLINKSGEKKKVIHPYKTKCFITDGKERGKILGVGVSTCSEKDRFNYTTGRKIALRRALNTANFSREERKEVWEKYLN